MIETLKIFTILTPMFLMLSYLTNKFGWFGILASILVFWIFMEYFVEIEPEVQQSTQR